MEASRWFGSFDPPRDADADASRRPASILLEQFAHIGDRMNKDTIATVESIDGHTMEFSFWIHPPPVLSYFCVQCHMLSDSRSKDADFEDEPHVVGAEGRFVLLRARFESGYGKDEYFIYKVGDIESGELASVHPVPLPNGYRLPRLDEFGIVPCSHGGHYLLAALSLGLSSFYYQLHIYSSRDERWTKIQLLNPCPEVSKVITSKVITLGEGVIGWVDFQHGMLVCDLKKGYPSPRYIPLPEPLPQNRDKLNVLLPGPSTRRFRDLTCINGVIKFIEMERQATEKSSDPSDKDLLFDSDCILSRRFKDVDDKPKQVHSWNSWRVVTWSRTVSCSCWHKGSVIGVADISVDKSVLLKCETIVEKILHSGFPILSPDADDILYLKSVPKFSDPNGWMIAVDLRRRRVEALGAYSSAMPNPLVKAYCSFILSTHVNMDPGLVTACCKITDAGSCADDPYNTATDSCESDNKRPRLATPNDVQNISRLYPLQNNLPQKQCFFNLDKPCQPGRSSWHHQNNLLLHQYFDKWVRPCDPRYVPMVPVPNLHGYVNYQPLGRHLTPSSVFGYHEAPETCVNKAEVIYHGDSQPLPPSTSLAYGTHSHYSDNVAHQL